MNVRRRGGGRGSIGREVEGREGIGRGEVEVGGRDIIDMEVILMENAATLVTVIQAVAEVQKDVQGRIRVPGVEASHEVGAGVPVEVLLKMAPGIRIRNEMYISRETWESRGTTKPF